jgi:hypothetical protein
MRDDDVPTSRDAMESIGLGTEPPHDYRTLEGMARRGAERWHPLMDYIAKLLADEDDR